MQLFPSIPKIVFFTNQESARLFGQNLQRVSIEFKKKDRFPVIFQARLLLPITQSDDNFLALSRS